MTKTCYHSQVPLKGHFILQKEVEVLQKIPEHCLELIQTEADRLWAKYYEEIGQCFPTHLQREKLILAEMHSVVAEQGTIPEANYMYGRLWSGVCRHDLAPAVFDRLFVNFLQMIDDLEIDEVFDEALTIADPLSTADETKILIPVAA